MQILSGSEFTFEKWKSGTYTCLGLTNHVEILHKKGIIKKYAIGYDSLNNPVRQKLNHKCIMFFKDGLTFWSHLTNNEFKEIFENER